MYQKELEELMDKSGCDLIITVCFLYNIMRNSCNFSFFQISNVTAIAECIVLYEALYKRKSYLDSLANGLEVLQVKEMISNFPEKFKPAFVHVGELSSSDVLKMLHPKPNESEMNDNTERIWNYLIVFINSADHAGKIL